MSIEFEIDLSDLTEDAVRRLLKGAVRMQARNSLPVGKRGKRKAEEEEADEEEVCDCCGESDCDCEQECENDTKVEMSRRGMKPSLPSVTSADLPKGMNLAPYKAKKNGKGTK